MYIFFIPTCFSPLDYHEGNIIGILFIYLFTLFMSLENTEGMDMDTHTHTHTHIQHKYIRT